MTVRPRPRPLPTRPVPRPMARPTAPQAMTTAPTLGAPAAQATPPPTSPAPLAPAPSPNRTVPAAPVAPCCPDAATFAVSSPRSAYFAFDDRTNKPATSAGEYFTPPTDAKTLPSSKEDRDASNWVSVAVGKTTEVVIDFLGGTAACINNATYVVAPSSIAKVVAPLPTATGAKFKIEGLAAGEATIAVTCTGKTLGWIHVWCAAEVTIAVDVCSIVSENIVTTPATSGVPATTTTTAISRSANYNKADLEAYINAVFHQLAIKFVVTDHGDVKIAETAAYSSSQARNITVEALARAAKTFTGSYQMFYWVDVAAHSGGLGRVPGGVGTGKGAFSFFDFDVTGAYNTMAHELGHCLNLSHPIHDSDQDEFPLWQLARFRMSGSTKTNVLLDDNWNLMGYEGPVSSRGANRTDMRYRQWKKCRRS